MNGNKQHTGFAVALAWPETYCKQPGSWYDPITVFLGISENNYYKVGHAAVVLAGVKNRKFHYFDFGRYHAPFGHGRVRSGETDDDLRVYSIPEFTEDNKSILNLNELLTELQNNPSCHGEGTLFASYIPVNFQTAFSKAKQMQVQSPIPYGPFIYKGSNCSRFVNTIVRAGNPHLKYQLKLRFKVPLTPTPISNVNTLENKTVMPKLLRTEPLIPLKKLESRILKSTLQAPEKHSKIPHNAQWLSGEGAGSWFAFEAKDELLLVNRFAPDGTLECSGTFGKEKNLNHLYDGFTITYPSNCKQVTLRHNTKKYIFRRL
ncbi:MAG TPA: hypothetical protein DCG75_04810 [Bacteroidales bacterium]|nr:hypothetical protein [Bacteroidales bacterium]